VTFHWSHFFLTIGILSGAIGFAAFSGAIAGWLQSKDISPAWYLGTLIVVVAAAVAFI
jgi:hypothetical protein